MLIRTLIQLLFLISIQASASDVAEIGQSDAHFVLGPFIEYLEDSESQHSASTLLGSQGDVFFKKNSAPVFNRGMNYAPHWIKTYFKVNAPQQTSIERLIKIKHVGLRDLLFYYARVEAGKIDVGSVKQVLRADFVSGSSLLIPVTLQTNATYVLLLRAQSNTYMKVPMSLWIPTAYYKKQLTNNIVHGAVCGILFSVLIYYLISFIQIRKALMLYGGLLTFSILLMVMSSQGSFYHYFLFGSAHGAEMLTLVVGVLMPLGGVLFVRDFLCTAKNCAVEDKMLLALLPALGVASVCILIDVVLLRVFILVPVIAFWIVLSIWVGVRCWIKGFREARFFLLGWAIFFVSLASRLLEVMNIMPSNAYTDIAISFSPALTAVTFSMALSDRMNLSIKERSMLHRSTVSAMKQSDKIKDEFLTKISHELRTPMNGVLGALHILRTKPDKKEFEENIFAATMASRSMIGTVNNLLDYTEAVSGKMKLCNQTFSHNQFIKKICEDFDNECDLKGLRFILKSTLPENLYLDGDEEKLEHMLAQIVDNGVKFSNEGAVTLTISEYVVNNDGEIGIQYLVEDTGIGIDEAMKATLFDYFSQADNSLTRSYEGLGMGLSVARCILTLMGGNILINNRTQGGVVVEIKSPFKRAAYEQIVELETLDKIDSSNDEHYGSDSLAERPILIVEDNKVNQMVLGALLKKLGYAPLFAENGKVAVELLSDKNVQAILMDIQMPVMDGYEATKAIRASGTENAHVPIIAVTANAMSEDREHCLRVGMDDYIKKPVDAELIKRKLKIWLHKKAG
ncbi:MAG: hypothetical protein COB04_09345 [Gammaproteobacteria bacterium]|nr:MAG: hypothetical protein COB04_09345 [Gammaproteobacteria bacterium]